MSDHEKVRIAKITSVVVGAVAIVLGILFEGINVGYLVGWAFSVAASANLPALVMILFWKRVTSQGVIAAILVGDGQFSGLEFCSAVTRLKRSTACQQKTHGHRSRSRASSRSHWGF